MERQGTRSPAELGQPHQHLNTGSSEGGREGAQAPRGRAAPWPSSGLVPALSPECHSLQVKQSGTTPVGQPPKPPPTTPLELQQMEGSMKQKGGTDSYLCAGVAGRVRVWRAVRGVAGRARGGGLCAGVAGRVHVGSGMKY